MKNIGNITDLIINYYFEEIPEPFGEPPEKYVVIETKKYHLIDTLIGVAENGEFISFELDHRGTIYRFQCRVINPLDDWIGGPFTPSTYKFKMYDFTVEQIVPHKTQKPTIEDLLLDGKSLTEILKSIG